MTRAWTRRGLALAMRQRAQLLYTVPTLQNPAGRTLPHGAARGARDAAGRAGLWIVEDDPYRELRIAARRSRRWHRFPGPRTRIALSALSKIAAPGLRLGRVRAPGALRGP